MLSHIHPILGTVRNTVPYLIHKLKRTHFTSVALLVSSRYIIYDVAGIPEAARPPVDNLHLINNELTPLRSSHLDAHRYLTYLPHLS